MPITNVYTGISFIKKSIYIENVAIDDQIRRFSSIMLFLMLRRMCLSPSRMYLTFTDRQNSWRFHQDRKLLGVFDDSYFSSSIHCREIASKVRRLLFIIKQSLLNSPYPCLPTFIARRFGLILSALCRRAR